MARLGLVFRVGIVVLAAWVGCGSVAAAGSTPPEVVLLRHVTLDPPPGDALGALAMEERLLVPDFSGGHVREYDLATGKQVAERGVSGSRPGEMTKPTWVFTQGDDLGVADFDRLQIISFGRDWTFKSEITTKLPSGRGYSFLVPPLWLGDRLVGAGIGHPEVFGGRERVYLFSVKPGGPPVPLLWRDASSDPKVDITSSLFGGGLADLGAAGWIFLDPATDEYRVFDRSDREVRRFKGDKAHWSAPDLAARPGGSDREAYFGWQLAQAGLGQPVDLGGGKLGTLVRGRAENGVVGYVLEVYDAEKGAFLRSAELPLPREKSRYLIRARAETGRLVVVLRAGWQAGSATEVYDFRVTVGGAPAAPAAR